MDEIVYAKYQKGSLEEHEALCKRCGVCCGSLDDPCSNLKVGNDGRYYCASYNDRFGEQSTVSGIKFTCVPIRDILVYAPPTEDCGYAA